MNMLFPFIKENRKIIFLFTLTLLSLLTLFMLQKIRPSSISSSPRTFIKTDHGNGWSTYERTGSGKITISLPNSWLIAGIDDGSLEILKDGIDNDPEIKKIMNGFQVSQMIKSRWVLIGYDEQTRSDSYTTNVTISHEPVPQNMDFEDFVKAELDSVKYPLLSRSNIDYQSGQAERVEIDLNRITSGGDRQTLRSIDYFLFQKSSGAFVIDFTTSNMESNADISTYDQIAKSFSWIEVQ